MNRTIILLLAITTILQIKVSAQTGKPETTIAKFIITQVTQNGKDQSAYYLDRKQYFAFYDCESGELCMANVSGINNDQSYGNLVSNQKVESYPETPDHYKFDIFTFKWNYANTYDSKTGWATILFYKLYKPQGVTFMMRIVLPNSEVDIYQGYMEGTLDFDKYSK